jgi:hypothetical protein
MISHKNVKKWFRDFLSQSEKDRQQTRTLVQPLDSVSIEAFHQGLINILELMNKEEIDLFGLFPVPTCRKERV